MRLVLPEGEEVRILKASRILLDESLVLSITVLGDRSKIEKIAQGEKIDLSGIDIAESGRGRYFDDFASEYYDLRKHRGIDLDEADPQRLANWEAPGGTPGRHAHPTMLLSPGPANLRRS